MVTKTKAKTAPVIDIDVQSETVAEPTLREQLHRMLDEALDDTSAPSWQRRAIGLLAGVAVAAGVGYVGGYAAVAVAVGAALVTSSMFVFYVIYVLGMLLAMYLGSKASIWAYTRVVDKSIDRAWYWSKAWLNPGIPA